MVTQPPTESGATFPAALGSLLDPTRRVLSEQVASELDDDEVVALRDLLAPDAHRPSGVRLDAVIGALAARDGSESTAAALVRFARNRDEQVVDRAVAVAGLRLAPGATTRSGLARLLDTPDYLVRLEAIRALGHVGDAGSLRVLDGLARSLSAPEARQRDFARSLIAHRLGVRSDYLPFRDGVARKDGNPDEYVELALTPLDVAAVAEQVDQFRGSAYGIEPSRQVGLALRAGRARWSVLVNDELAADSSGELARSSSFFTKPWITALLARVDTRRSRSATQYVVLSDPNDHGAQLMIVRSDGEVMYSGALSSSEGALEFVVRDVARHGTAPTNVRGQLTDSGLELDVAIPFRRRLHAARGEAITPPEAAGITQ